MIRQSAIRVGLLLRDSITAWELEKGNAAFQHVFWFPRISNNCLVQGGFTRREPLHRSRTLCRMCREVTNHFSEDDREGLRTPSESGTDLVSLPPRHPWASRADRLGHFDQYRICKDVVTNV
jgi:hypothetical protein